MEYKLGLDYLYMLAEVKETAAEPLLMVAITERLEAIATALERVAAGMEWQIEQQLGDIEQQLGDKDAS